MSHKVLFVIHKLTYGGAGKVMAFLANSFSLDGDRVYLLTYENNIVMQKLAPEVKHIDFSYSPPSIFGIRRIFQIIHVRNVFNKIQPDVIISFLPYPNIISILASIGAHIPVVISQRADPSVLQSWFTKFRDFIYNFADGYVFQTIGAKNYYNKRIQAKSVVIPNPVVTDDLPARWMGDKEDIIVHVGRFELEQKRQDILIKAFSRIAEKYPSINLVLFGDGTDEPKIKGFISESYLENRVILAGFTMNVYEAIKKAKLFVLSSDYEGMPNALIEAMAVGLPCVSTDCSPGGAAELIKHMENGMLVKAGCVDELAAAMDFMLSNPQIAENMGNNALKITIDLNPEAIINQWNTYINNLISAKSVIGKK